MTNEQMTTTTTDAESGTLVFKDQAGDYYLLPLTMLQRGRVPEEAKAALEEQLAAMPAGATAGEEVQGYRYSPALVGYIAGVLTTWASYGITRLIMTEDPIEQPYDLSNSGLPY